jgi:hypothetical protein
VATAEQLAERASPHLPAGSEVRQAFVCQTASSFALFVINWMTALTMPWITYRCVAVTQDAIYVLDAPSISGGANPRSIVATLPRRTRLGPVSGRWGQFTLLGQRHWIKERFQPQIVAADAEAGFTDNPT